MQLKKVFPLLAMAQLSMAEETPAAEPAKVKFAKKEYDLDTSELSITFGNGQELAFALSDLSPEIQKQLALHGLSQKLGDSYAGVKGNFAEAINNVNSVFASLKSGDWSTAGEEARPRLAELAEAIASIKKVPIEKAMAAVEKATDDQRKGWRSNAQVKAAIAQNRAVKAQKALEGQAPSELTVDLG